MLIFRTVLLWLAFAILLVLEFQTILNLRESIILRLVPSGLLLLWFLTYLAGRKRIIVKSGIRDGKWRLMILLKQLANVVIIIGALMKIGHYAYAQPLLIIGIGFLAVWSTLLSVVSREKSAYDPEIIDDVYDETNEE